MEVRSEFCNLKSIQMAKPFNTLPHILLFTTVHIQIAESYYNYYNVLFY
jgi:hypothetical protein